LVLVAGDGYFFAARHIGQLVVANVGNEIARLAVRGDFSLNLAGHGTVPVSETGERK
jgi:hypothetical protein